MDIAATMRRLTGPLAGRIEMMIGRAVIAAIADAPQAQAMQIELLADEVHDGVERFQGYGFTSHPHPGAEAIVVFPGGTRSHGIVIQVEDRRYRLKNIAPGEVALFDDLDQIVHLKRDGIHIESLNKVTIEAPDIEVIADSVVIDSPDIGLGGASGAKVARVGDDVDLGTGKIISGSDVVRAG